MHDRAISIQNDKHREAKILSSSNLHSGLRSRFFIYKHSIYCVNIR